MSLHAGEHLHGFTVDRVRQVAELSASLVEMSHDKTGAKLVWVDNGETNKLFSIAFKTLPEDSTGVFHILEHSLLCGSDKFPVKEPFVELLKSSMNTFLNAMTFPDKTMYPVSSRNEQDFMNLTEVYLDAVFAPAILHNRNIFYQEGWHIELDSPDSTPTYKGVVFNEMKGALSSVGGVIEQGMRGAMFPDTCYGFNSGGDPRVIPTLTYEQFLNMYRRYYHPSNSLIWLDGAVPLDRVLTLIDGYLSRFERSEERHDIALQTPVTCERTQFYEVSAADGTQNKAMLSLGKIVGTWQDVHRTYAVDILSDALTGSNEAPLKRALLSSGLCQDMDMTGIGDSAQSVMVLTVKNIDPENAPAIRALIRKICAELCEKGIGKDELLASINRYEFRLREPSEPAGLMRNIMALNTWLYGGDPLTALIYDDAFLELRAMAENGGFEQLLHELLVDEDGLLVMHTLPSTTLGEEMRAEEAARLSEISARWTAQEKAAILEMNEQLHAWQQTPDTPEQLRTLPMLDIREVSPDPALLHTEEATVGGVTVLTHRAATNGIVHLNLYFNLSDCTLEELCVLNMLSRLLGVLPTAKYSAPALQKAVKTHLGRLSFSLEAKEKLGCTQRCTPVLRVNCSVMATQLELARELICEILTATDFTDTARIREIALQVDEQTKQMCIMAGHVLAMTAAQAHYSAACAVNEVLRGYTGVQWLHNLVAHFDEQIGAHVALLRDKLAKAACRARLTLSVTANVDTDVSALLAALPMGEACAPDAAYAIQLPLKLGIRIPAQIGYGVLSSDLEGEWDGSALVAANILSLSYLWNVIRVQGGAYGCGFNIGRKMAVAYSYRDPTPGRSLDMYRGAASFLREFVQSGEPIGKFIISTIAATEPLLPARDEGARADGDWFSGRTEEMQRRDRAAILATDAQKLLRWCQLLEHMAQSGAVCVVAHDEALRACEAEGLEIAE
ncbi:MAG: insulinase family protein [Clostridiales bacterium]|nr:insulinase family protein [Clostridiales bacterium]